MSDVTLADAIKQLQYVMSSVLTQAVELSLMSLHNAHQFSTTHDARTTHVATRDESKGKLIDQRLQGPVEMHSPVNLIPQHVARLCNFKQSSMDHGADSFTRAPT